MCVRVVWGCLELRRGERGARAEQSCPASAEALHLGCASPVAPLPWAVQAPVRPRTHRLPMVVPVVSTVLLSRSRVSAADIASARSFSSARCRAARREQAGEAVRRALGPCAAAGRAAARPASTASRPPHLQQREHGALDGGGERGEPEHVALVVALAAVERVLKQAVENASDTERRLNHARREVPAGEARAAIARGRADSGGRRSPHQRRYAAQRPHVLPPLDQPSRTCRSAACAPS